MSRVLFVAVLAVVLLGLAPPAAAQLHTTGWIYGGVPAPLSPASYGVLGHIDLSGAMKLWVDPAAYPKVFDGSTTVEGGTMGPGNAYHVVAIASTKLHQSFLIVDLSGKIVNTLVVTPVPPDKGGGWVVDVAVDPNGDYLVLEAPPTGIKGGALYRFNPTTFVLVTLHAGAPFSSPTAVTVDVDTGDAIVVNTPYLYRIPPSGSSISTIGRFGVPVLGQVTQDIRSGDFFACSNWNQDPGALIARMTPKGVASVFFDTGFVSCTAVAADRASAAAPRLAFGIAGNGAGVYFVDLATKAVTTLTTAASYRFTGLWADRGRNLSAVADTLIADRWAFYLDFPGEGGLPYALGISGTGVRPGVKLSDGRCIPFQVDVLTALSVNGHLGGMLVGHAGYLDRSGAAKAVLNSTKNLRGFRIWAIAITLDPAAPLGIRTIADPAVLNL